MRQVKMEHGFLRWMAGFLVLASGLSLAPASRAADWPHWRGPARTGVTAESSGWAGGRWPAAKAAWSITVGEGCTSPLVAGGRVFAMGWHDGKDRVVCLDAATGRESWSVSYPCPRYGRHHVGDEVYYGGPTSTPEYDAETDCLYTLGVDGDLNCWEVAHKGRKKWGFNLYARYGALRRPKVGPGGARRDYGYTTSPLIHGDWLLVEVGGKEGNLMAFDRRSGKQRWSSECKDLAGHTGGLAPMTVEGVPCVCVLTLTNLVVIRLDKGNEGKTVVAYPWITSFANNIVSPVVEGNEVLITSEYNHKRIVKLAVTLKGIRKVWEAPFCSKACTPVVHRGHVYWAWQKLYCLDLKTGECVWEGGSFGDPGSCIVTADGRLIVWGEFGRLALVETFARSPRAYKELARQNRVFAAHAWPHVVLAGGRLFCKDRRGNLKCFVVAAGAKERP
jgi:outer membrane protein assembly factor BamB